MSNNLYYIIHSTSFGDTLASTPTLRYLSKSHRQKINIVTHRKDVFINNPYVKDILNFDEYFSRDLSNIIKYESHTFAGQKDGNGIEKKFSHMDVRQIHAIDLGFQLPNEDLEYDFYPNPLSLDIELPEKYVVLHVTTNWPNRTWAYDNWIKLIKWLKENNIFTVLVGAGYKESLHRSYSDGSLVKDCPMFEDYYGLDLTNQGSMGDMWWVINGSQCIVTMDSGPLHLASCTDAHIIQLGSAINPTFKRFYRNGDWKHKYHFLGGACTLFCNTNLFYNVKEWGDINSVPPQPHCLENKPTYECHPSCESVIEKLNTILNNSKNIKKDKKLKFGIYTSFYNSQRFIENAFNTIENLNYNNFEWHITDDFSNDNTKELLLERLELSSLKHKIKFCEQDYKKQMYWKPNEFFDETFDWIVLIDSDDSVDVNFLTIYNNVINEVDDLALISSDGHKINEENNSLHSILYVKNDEKISEKINKYHPSCDYLNNISYSCFGLLRAFNNKLIKEFKIDDNLACAEDSYRVFWCNSHGKYLHIPRPLYKWMLRTDSESHSTNIKENFNGNFKNALKFLNENDFGIETLFNDVYIETSALASYDFEMLKNKNVTLWTRYLTDEQIKKLNMLYYDTNLKFNEKNSEINILCLNYFSEDLLEDVLKNVNQTKLLFYYQNNKKHYDNESKDEELNRVSESYRKIIGKYLTNFSWWSYIRHLIIKN